MKKLKVRFEKDSKLNDIEVVIRANEENAQVKELIRSLTRGEPEKLTLLDKNGNSCVVEEKEIVFLSADGKQVIVTAESGVYYAKQSLQSIEEIMNSDGQQV